MSSSFPCPHCQAATEVKDSRPNQAGIRRRRRCSACNRRFTTFELRAEDVDSVLVGVQDAEPIVVQQATETVNIIGRLSREDRIMLLAVARRLAGNLGQRLHAISGGLDDAA